MEWCRTKYYLFIKSSNQQEFPAKHIRVPLIPGFKLARIKKLKVGWAMCRIKKLASRKGCAKCSAFHHATSECKGEEKRKCFRCKAVGHLIASCMLSHQGGKSGEPDRGQRTGNLI
ncbi:cold shock domain-containing protein 3-like [Aphis craccivora]|uniref:Cold shock domain-containing protein 3-like n=1 Tax=Aphis craccivora TaxID=307492 RepID=A0A6G0W1T9_APHCR|nr:cold shock domain-containing protein 3-like [Aphis craccivora]